MRGEKRLGARRVPHHDPLELRQLVTPCENLVHLVEAFDERDFGIRVVEDVSELLRRERRVRAQSDRAGKLTADVAVAPLRSRTSDHADLVAEIEPEPDQVRGHGP